VECWITDLHPLAVVAGRLPRLPDGRAVWLQG
jgi:hypothetical protein